MEKQAYEQKWQAKLDELDARLKLLIAKAQGVQADAKIKLDKQIQDIQQKRQEAQGHLEKIKSAGRESWRDMIGSFESASNDLLESLDRAKDRFKQLLQ